MTEKAAVFKDLIEQIKKLEPPLTGWSKPVKNGAPLFLLPLDFDDHTDDNEYWVELDELTLRDIRHYAALCALWWQRHCHRLKRAGSKTCAEAGRKSKAWTVIWEQAEAACFRWEDEQPTEEVGERTIDFDDDEDDEVEGIRKSAVRAGRLWQDDDYRTANTVNDLQIEDLKGQIEEIEEYVVSEPDMDPVLLQEVLAQKKELVQELQELQEEVAYAGA